MRLLGIGLFCCGYALCYYDNGRLASAGAFLGCVGMLVLIASL